MMYFKEHKCGGAAFCYFTDQLTSQDSLARKLSSRQHIVCQHQQKE